MNSGRSSKISGRSSKIIELNFVVDEIYKTLEEVRAMFQKWESSYHMPFIEKCMYLNILRERLYKLGYADDFVETIIKLAYEHVFSRVERAKYDLL